MINDTPYIFAEKAAIYFENESYFEDQQGHILMPKQPLYICDKTASTLNMLGRKDIYISESTYFYDGSGCC